MVATHSERIAPSAPVLKISVNLKLFSNTNIIIVQLK